MAYSRHSRYGQTSLDGHRFPRLPDDQRARNGWLWGLGIVLILGICVATGCGLHALLTGGTVTAGGTLGPATPVKAAGLVAFGGLATWLLSDLIDARVERAYWRSPMGQAELAEDAGDPASGEGEIDRSLAMDERGVVNR